MAIASRSVDLPLPFSPMRNVTALERSRASMALMEGIENGNASRSGTVSQQISAEIRPPVGSATPPAHSPQLHGLVAARRDRPRTGHVPTRVAHHGWQAGG